MEISYEAKLADRAEALKDFFGGDDKEATSVEKLELLDQFESLMIKYRAAVREVTTKLEVLNDELSSFAERNPIEGIQSRIKRPYSIAKKLKARGLPVAVESISEESERRGRNQGYLSLYQRHLRCGGYAAEPGGRTSYREKGLYREAEGKWLQKPSSDC